MIELAGFGFVQPFLLAGLLSLPILWWLLRATPPAPMRSRFPPVVLLLGLRDEETTPDRTPWWLLLLRMLALAAVIVGFAGPVKDPNSEFRADAALLVSLDGSWASAGDWEDRKQKVEELLRRAQANARPVAVVQWTDAPRARDPIVFGTGQGELERVQGLEPQAWDPLYSEWADVLEAHDGAFDSVWLSDGLTHDAAERERLVSLLRSKGRMSVITGDEVTTALRDPRIENGKLTVTVLREEGSGGDDHRLVAVGPGPRGINRVLGREQALMEDGAVSLDVALDLPTEISNRVQYISLESAKSAGEIVIMDDAVRRHRVALIGGATEQEGNLLLSPLHYLRQAFAPTAEIIEVELADALSVDPDVLVFADVGRLTPEETARVERWVDAGGLLLRFAGPQLAALGSDPQESDPLLPVRLRAGGRHVGGALSWGDPKRLGAFPKQGPFAGLPIPDDVRVRRQVMAQPGPNLSERTLAELQDGTPLITARDLGLGRLILFHVSADSGWSSLPLSGLFVDMLDRLAISARRKGTAPELLVGLNWTPVRVMDAFGTLRDEDSLPAIPGEHLASARPTADMPPGIFESGNRRIALNVIGPDRELVTASWPADVDVSSLSAAGERDLKPWFLAAAVLLLVVDLIATLWLSGRITGTVRPRGAGPTVAAFAGGVAALVTLSLMAGTVGAKAQEASRASGLRQSYAANNTVLAYVLTGNQRQDAVSAAGLLGLSTVLFQRTSVEPVEPVGIDPAVDDLSVYPFLYWPVVADQPLPGDDAIRRLNTFLRTGGVVLFDTLDGDLGSYGGESPNTLHFRQIVEGLSVPPLEPVPPDHVLTRSFYLIQDFPGRHRGADLWVEAAPDEAEQMAGVPFRHLNDGVTPVVIGSNDWASAWAIDDDGRFLLPVGHGASGMRQRERAFRFGINLIMYVLTGNYKSDQVHVPALLERLGQ